MLTRIEDVVGDRYRIERELGSGGMATVWLAQDLRHDRPVAIKVVHRELAAAIGGERFLSEIRTTARLQHPHILPLLDSGQASGNGTDDGGPLFYVMPYVAGESLRDRLNRETQLPVDDAIRIAQEVADALGHAHAQGIIHRDIKPENILLQGGHALVADFGIALAVTAAGGTRLTQTGLSLGTPQYMSPEQAMGERSIDARSDIYALGAVTYEMLAGEPPFTGATVQAIVAKVLNERPVPLSTVRDAVPAHVERAILKALARIPADRYTTALEFSRELLTPGSTRTETSVATLSRASRVSNMPWVLTAISLASAAATVVWAVSTRIASDTRPAFETRFPVDVPQGFTLLEAMPSISRDGQTVAFAAESAGVTRLLLRRMGSLAAVPLRGTDGADSGPVFSPDGRWVLFRADTRLMRVSVDGSGSPERVPGAPLLGTVGGPLMVDWADDGSLLLIAELADGVLRVSTTGERTDTLRFVSRDSDELGLMYPVNLPGADAMLFAVLTRSGWRLVVRKLDGSREVTLVQGATKAQFVPPDRLLYSKDAVVYATRFDPSALRLVGEAVALTAQLPNVSFARTHAPYYAMSVNGTLVHIAGTPRYATGELVLVDRMGGRMTPLRELAGARPRFLPDGRSLVAEDSFRIWMYDLVRGGTRVPLSAAGLTFTPVPTPDGARIVTSTYEGGPAQLWSYAAGNWEDVLRLAPSPRRRYATSFTADGKTMTFGEEGGESQRDIWILQGDSARPFLRSSASEYHARLSPDGRWLAYTSDQGTRPEVYLQAFPAGGRAVRVSVAGGSEPVWHPDRSELFFRNGDTIYSSTITGSMTPAASEPEFVVRIDGLSRGDAISFAYDVSSDGRQFVAVKEPPKLHDRQLHVVLNARTAQGSAGR